VGEKHEWSYHAFSFNAPRAAVTHEYGESLGRREDAARVKLGMPALREIAIEVTK
jgi:hypothetical protein